MRLGSAGTNPNPDPVSEVPDGLGKGQSLELHDEAEHVPTRTASETVVDPLVRAHDEGGSFLRVKGAEPLVVLPCLLQMNVLADYLGNIGTLLDLIDDVFGYRQWYSDGPLFVECGTNGFPEPFKSSSVFSWPSSNVQLI